MLVLDDFSDFAMAHEFPSGCETDPQNEPHSVDDPGTVFLTADRKSQEFRTDRRVIHIPAGSLSGLLLNLLFEVTRQKGDNLR